MSRIYLDTNVYIYYFEEDPQFGAAARAVFQSLSDPSHRLFGSLYTFSELLVTPVRANDEFRIAYLRRFFHSSNIALLEMTMEAAFLYARLRAFDRVKPLDALHLACAATGGVDLFVTNDRGLTGLRVPGIGAIVTMDVSF